MEYDQVRYFVALCQTLNFTRAAEASNVSQPALTCAIQKLEEELGGQLIYRERNLTRLTELGQTIRPHLEAMLDAAEGRGRPRDAGPVIKPRRCASASDGMLRFPTSPTRSAPS